MVSAFLAEISAYDREIRNHRQPFRFGSVGTMLEAERGTAMIYLDSLILLVFAILLAVPLAWRGIGRWRVWLAIIAGSAIFVIIWYTQTPIQNWLIQWSQQQNALFQALLLGLLNGLWQEGFRFAGLWVYGFTLKPGDWPWAGAAFGLGFAAAESVFILFQLESTAADSGLSLTPALLFGDALPLTVERLALTAFSISISVLLGIGFLRHRPAGPFVIALLTHFALSFFALYRRQWGLSIWTTLAIVGIIALSFYLWAWVASTRVKQKTIVATGPK
jgi:hypothetical protein